MKTQGKRFLFGGIKNVNKIILNDDKKKLIENFVNFSLNLYISLIVLEILIMEPLSSYTISNVSAEQVKDFMELTRLAGVTISYEMMK